MTTCAVQDVPGRECLWCTERSDTVDFSQSIKASVVGCDLLAGGRLVCPAGLSGANIYILSAGQHDVVVGVLGGGASRGATDVDPVDLGLPAPGLVTHSRGTIAGSCGAWVFMVWPFTRRAYSL